MKQNKSVKKDPLTKISECQAKKIKSEKKNNKFDQKKGKREKD